MPGDGVSDVVSSPTDLFGPVQALLRGNKTLRDIEVLLDKGANPDEWKGPLTPVRCAVQARNTRLLALLLNKGASCDAKDSKGVSALHIAVFDNKIDCARLLLDARADVNTLDRHGQSPLFFAPTRQICELLISSKADTNLKNNKSQSALHLAAHAGLNETVACLAKATGKKILESQDHRGHTPLFYAAHSRMKSTLSVLQKQGAELKVREPRDRPRSAQSENPSTTLDETDLGAPSPPVHHPQETTPDVVASAMFARPVTPTSLAESALPAERSSALPQDSDIGESPQEAQANEPMQGAYVNTPEGPTDDKADLLSSTPPKERAAQRRSTPPTVEVEEKVSSPLASQISPTALSAKSDADMTRPATPASPSALLQPAVAGSTRPATPAEGQQQQQQQEFSEGHTGFEQVPSQVEDAATAIAATAIAATVVTTTAEEAAKPESPSAAWAPVAQEEASTPVADEHAVALDARPASSAFSNDAATSAVPDVEEATENVPISATAVVATPTVAITKGADTHASEAGAVTVAVAAQEAPEAWESSGAGVLAASVPAVGAARPDAEAEGIAAGDHGVAQDGGAEAATEQPALSPPRLPPQLPSQLRPDAGQAAAQERKLDRAPSTGSLGSLAEDSPPPARPVERYEKDGCLYWDVTLSKVTTNDKYGFVQANGKIEFETRAASNLRVTSERGDAELAKPSGPLLVGPESLIVRRIHNEGLMERWNKRHKECEVYTQDRIVQVNESTTVESMQREFRERRRVTMKVARYPERFAVMLRKSGGKSKLGLRFERPQQLPAANMGTPGTEVRISEVMEDGLLMDHNRHQVALGNWHYVVLPDMRIEAANRAMGDALLIAQELKDSREVTLTVRRAEQAMLSQQQVRQRLQKLAMAQVAQQQLSQLQMRQREEGAGSGTDAHGEAGQGGLSSAESGTDDERKARGGSRARGSSTGSSTRFGAAAKAAPNREEREKPKAELGNK